MIRFRFTEDEKRYLSLMSEAYRLLAKHAPADVTSKVMRNLGKMEQVAYFEGIRQGFAGAELSLMMEDSGIQEGCRHLKAFQAHAHVYGSSDTPLREVEMERVEAMNLGEDAAHSAWLDRNPMRFAPQTLREWEGEGAEKSTDYETFSERIDDELGRDPGSVPFIGTIRESEIKEGLSEPGDFANVVEGILEIERDTVPKTKAQSDWDDQPVNSPQFLDRVRDFLQEKGEEPDTWASLIMHLHRGMEVDAGYLDLVLSTPEGLTVLAQCGLTALHPGSGVDMMSFE